MIVFFRFSFNMKNQTIYNSNQFTQYNSRVKEKQTNIIVYTLTIKDIDEMCNKKETKQ